MFAFSDKWALNQGLFIWTRNRESFHVDDFSMIFGFIFLDWIEWFFRFFLTLFSLCRCGFGSLLKQMTSQLWAKRVCKYYCHLRNQAHCIAISLRSFFICSPQEHLVRYNDVRHKEQLNEIEAATNAAFGWVLKTVDVMLWLVKNLNELSY